MIQIICVSATLLFDGTNANRVFHKLDKLANIVIKGFSGFNENISLTRMHSGRMHPARLLTVHASVATRCQQWGSPREQV